jgi:uncharacterized membrane protein
MERQLSLPAVAERQPDWSLDDATREVGRQGLATVRASVRDARRRAEAARRAAADRTDRRSAA